MFFFCKKREKLATKEDIHRLETIIRQIESQIIMKISELEVKLASYGDTLAKIQTEVQALKDSINSTDADVPQSIVDSVARIDTLLAAVDDINTDVTDIPPITGGTPLRG